MECEYRHHEGKSREDVNQMCAIDKENESTIVVEKLNVSQIRLRIFTRQNKLGKLKSTGYSNTLVPEAPGRQAVSTAFLGNQKNLSKCFAVDMDV